MMDKALAVQDKRDFLGVVMRGKKAVVSSLDIARVFEKEHRHVLRDIQNLIGEIESNAPKFGLVKTDESIFGLASYEDEKGEMRPMYRLNRDGAMLLIMGYTGPTALALKMAYIQRFNEMEEALNNVRLLHLTGLYPPHRGHNFQFRQQGGHTMKMAVAALGFTKVENLKKVLVGLELVRPAGKFLVPLPEFVEKGYFKLGKRGSLIISDIGMDYLKRALLIGESDDYS